MNTKETTDLAKLLTKLPGIRSIDIKDVRHLVELLRESPEIGSIEVKGWFGTGVLITRTGNHAVQVSAPMAMPMAAAPVAAPVASPAPAAPAAAALKEIKSPMVGTFYRAPEPGAEPYVKVRRAHLDHPLQHALDIHAVSPPSAPTRRSPPRPGTGPARTQPAARSPP